MIIAFAVAVVVFLRVKLFPITSTRKALIGNLYFLWFSKKWSGLGEGVGGWGATNHMIINVI